MKPKKLQTITFIFLYECQHCQDLRPYRYKLGAIVLRFQIKLSFTMLSKVKNRTNFYLFISVKFWSTTLFRKK